MFFWAPLMKWCLVAAGIKDLSRPADKLSVSQNLGMYWLLAFSELHLIAFPAALAGTGFIWVRYSFVIIPVNYSLAAVRSLFPRSTRLLTKISSGQLLCRSFWTVPTRTYRSVSSLYLGFL